MKLDTKSVAIRIDIELYELIQKIKEPIEKFAWNAIKLSDTEASAVLAKKIKDANIL